MRLLPVSNDTQARADREMYRLLAGAEKLYGRRDERYKLVGVRFRDDDRAPRVFYPDTVPNGIAISLNHSVVSDAPRRRFQIAHEVVHFLAPVPNPDDLTAIRVTMLEEGMATAFSLAQPYGDDPTYAVRSEATIRGLYLEALQEFRDFWPLVRPFAFRQFRKTICASFDLMEAEQLVTHFGVTASMAHRLLAKHIFR